MLVWFSGKLQGCPQRNQELMVHALRRVSLSRVPTVIAGDLNCRVQDLPAWEHFRFLGYQELFEFYQERHGRSLPPTCKNSSRHDTFLLPPAVQHMFQSAQVCQRKFLDSHDPLLVGGSSRCSSNVSLWSSRSHLLLRVCRPSCTMSGRPS